MLGARLGTALCHAGDEVHFLAPASLALLLKDTPMRHGKIDLALRVLDKAVESVLQKDRYDSLVLADLSTLLKVFTSYSLEPGRLVRTGVPIVALDVWNLPDTDLLWDYYPQTYKMDLGPLSAARRLVPVPFIRPQGTVGAYRALPEIGPLSERERAAVRAELGVGADERLVFWPSASWQHARWQQNPHCQALGDALPGLLVSYLAALPAQVKVLHVGPEPFAAGAKLGPRYRFLSQLKEQTYIRYLFAADLLLSLNAAATSIGTAITGGVPTLLLQNSVLSGPTAPVPTLHGKPLTALVRDFLRTTPLHPFRIFPLSLYHFLAPAIPNNPYFETIDIVELLDQEAFTQRCLALLFSSAEQEAQRQRQQAYIKQVQSLPTGVEQFRTALRSPPTA